MAAGASRTSSSRSRRPSTPPRTSRLTSELFREGAKVLVVDRDSLPFVSGSELDFEDTVHRKGFLVNSNPNALSTCSCKKSFSPSEQVFEKLLER